MICEFLDSFSVKGVGSFLAQELENLFEFRYRWLELSLRQVIAPRFDRHFFDRLVAPWASFMIASSFHTLEGVRQVHAVSAVGTDGAFVAHFSKEASLHRAPTLFAPQCCGIWGRGRLLMGGLWRCVGQCVQSRQCLAVARVDAQDLAVTVGLLGGLVKQGRQQLPRGNVFRVRLQNVAELTSGSLSVTSSDTLLECV